MWLKSELIKLKLMLKLMLRLIRRSCDCSCAGAGDFAKGKAKTRWGSNRQNSWSDGF